MWKIKLSILLLISFTCFRVYAGILGYEDWEEKYDDREKKVYIMYRDTYGKMAKNIMELLTSFSYNETHMSLRLTKENEN